MKLFEPNLNSNNYAIPIIKLVISVAIITVCLLRNSIFHIENKLLGIICSFVAFVFAIICIIIVCISCCEIYATFENTHASVIANEKYGLMHINDVLLQIGQNDIIEYRILTDSGTILIGASSDNRYGSNRFFDKKYYCDKQEFDSIDELRNALSKFLVNDYLQVLSIDGIKVK